LIRNITMNKVIYFVSLPIILIVLNYSAYGAQHIPGPRLVLEEKDFDAKEVKEKGFIEHTFKVLNTGDSPLEIKKVKPG